MDARLDAIERKLAGAAAGPVKEEPPGTSESHLDIISRSDMEEPGQRSQQGIVSDEDAAREINGSPRTGKARGKDRHESKRGGDITDISDNMDRILEP